MHARTLPRHARTGLLALGWRRPRPGENGPQPVWPILGGAPDDGGDDDKGDQDDDADDESDTDDDGDGDGKGDDTTDHKAEAEKYKALMRKWQERAKGNAAAAKELAQLKREGMSEVEKRVDEAVAAARAEERVKAGERVARSAFLAAAKGRIDSPRDVADELNLRKYVDPETGEVDDDAITALVDKIAPKSDTDEDDDQDERDTRRRRRQGRGYQGARNGSGRSKDTKRGAAADGVALYEELIGPRRSTANN
jgi:hypothetical protein